MERQTHAWESRPGWGITVDLTPRELLAARNVKVHQRMIALALVVVVLLCAGVVLLAQASKTSAQDSYDAAQARTTELTIEANSYSVITTMQRVTEDVQRQLSTLMAQDVDFTNLLAKIRTALPPGISVTSANVLLSPPTGAPVTPNTAPNSARSVIGSVTLSGTGSRIDQVPPLVAILNGVFGVVDVVPLSVTKTSNGMSFSLSLNITDELYTHRFDLNADQGGAQ